MFEETRKNPTKIQVEAKEPIALSSDELLSVVAGCDCFDDAGILHGHVLENTTREAKDGPANAYFVINDRSTVG